MDEIKEYTVQLSAALRMKRSVQSVSGSEQKSIEEPQLRQRLDEFRKRIICFRMEAMLMICLMMCRNLGGNTKICGRIVPRLYRYLAGELQMYAGSFKNVRMRY